jgi:uncharacterized membrane protein YvlD (DUF360 family)
MRKRAISILAYLVASSVGLLLALLLLDGFRIDFVAFLLAVVIFSVATALLTPLVENLSKRYVPQLAGGVALAVVALGLLVTALIMPGMVIGGVANWLAATLLVWLGSLLAQILLPIYVFKELRGPGTGS